MDIKTQIQQKAKSLYPEGRAQPKRFTPEAYIPLCEQAAFIAGAEWLDTEIVQPLRKENEGLKGIIKDQKKRIEDLEFSAKGLLHLHACEQEGLLSGQPKPEAWVAAVNDLTEVAYNL